MQWNICTYFIIGIASWLITVAYFQIEIPNTFLIIIINYYFYFFSLFITKGSLLQECN